MSQIESPDLNVEELSRNFSQSNPNIWRRYGWLMSEQNKLDEDSDRAELSSCAGSIMVYLRQCGFHLGAAREIQIAQQIAALSCRDQGFNGRI